jgi:hypothetical protein
MSYSFETDILGVKAEIEGTFDPGEKETFDCPGEKPSFEIETITINDEEFEVDSLSTETLETIEQLAFDDAHNNYDPY